MYMRSQSARLTLTCKIEDTLLVILTMHTENRVNNTDVSMRAELNKIWKSVGCVVQPLVMQDRLEVM